MAIDRDETEPGLPWKLMTRCAIMVDIGDLFGGCFWRWMLLVSRHLTHDSHDFKADVPNLTVQTNGWRTFFVTSRFQHRLLVGEWFGGTCNASRLMPTTSRDSTTRNVSMCFARKH